MSREQAFVQAIASLSFASVDLASSIARLEAWLSSLEAALAAVPLSTDGLRQGAPSPSDACSPDPSSGPATGPGIDTAAGTVAGPASGSVIGRFSGSVSDPISDSISAPVSDSLTDLSLAAQVDDILAALGSSRAGWQARWAALEPAQALAGQFDDKAVLLVFGKFNAGKSTLCNFLAERFAAQGQTVRGFRLDRGRIVDSSEALLEGATETTAALQGLILAERLVLVDTPGLHSVTGENAELTRRFTDSADGLLWLTSSASPGQVQELDELARELRRDKPLLPVVTRSDTIEEDEVDGALQRVLCNKSAGNRQLQEDDVRQRAAARLEQMGIDPGLLRAPVSVSVRLAREQGESAQALADAGFERLHAALLDLVGPALAYKQRKPAAVLLHHLQENVLGLLEQQVLPRLDALATRLGDEQDRLAGQPEALARAVWRQVVPTLPALLDAAEQRPDAWCEPALGELARRLSLAIDKALAEAARHGLADYRLDAATPTRIEWEAGAFVGGPAGHEQRYLALEGAVERALQQTGRVVEPCVARVTALQAAVVAIREQVDDHRASLRRCRDDLGHVGAARGDAAADTRDSPDPAAIPPQRSSPLITAPSDPCPKETRP